MHPDIVVLAMVCVDVHGRRWKSAVDPKSGRTYYYDIETRHTRWEAPPLPSTRDFFRQMEENMRKPVPSRPIHTREEGVPSLFRTLSSMDVLDIAAPRMVQRRRSNSTSTISISRGVMTAPDPDCTIQAVCLVLHRHMQLRGRSDPKYDVFNAHDRPRPTMPPVSELVVFMKGIYGRAQMESEGIILTLIYVERLLQATAGGLVLGPTNWQAVVFSAMVMASKVWDDMSMWNADFSKICPPFTLQRVNALERAVLTALSYRVRVTARTYAMYYFHLRAMDGPVLDLEAGLTLACVGPDRKRRMTVMGVGDDGTAPRGRRSACLEQLVHMAVKV